MNPMWSPDGETIAFANFYLSTTAGPNLYLMNADESEKRPFKVMMLHGDEHPALAGWDPAWSPDGTRLTFSICLDCNAGGRNYEIYVADVESREYRQEDVRRLTNHLSLDSGASWSPAGKHIAFASSRDHPGRRREDLYLVNADGSNLRRLTETEGVGGFTWSPDGRHLAAWVQDELYRVGLDGAMQPIAWTPPEGYEDYDGLFPMDWPLQDHMLVVARQTGVYKGTPLLLILNPTTGKARPIEIDLTIYSMGRVDWHVPPSAR